MIAFLFAASYQLDDVANPAKTRVSSVCSIHCKKARLPTLKKRESERIFLQQILHAIVTKDLARFDGRVFEWIWTQLSALLYE